MYDQIGRQMVPAKMADNVLTPRKVERMATDNDKFLQELFFCKNHSDQKKINCYRY